MIDPSRPHLIYADAVQGENPIEAYDLTKTGNFKFPIESNIKQQFIDLNLGKNHWLPFAAEVYNISPNIKDYIFVPCTTMLNDLPNRNGVGFPLPELTRFNPEYGTLAYRSWIGKPAHLEHQNKIFHEAKGVIFDTALRSIPKYKGGIFALDFLTGFDRSKDPILANAILKKESTWYSMGAYCRAYSCSYCGSIHGSLKEIPCEHVTIGKPQLQIIEGWLAYLEAVDPIGFEISAVSEGAFPSSLAPDYMLVE